MLQEELRAEIEAHEEWLASLDVEVDLPPGLLERTKQHVRLALDEAWLTAEARVEPRPGLLASVKQAVARELAAMPAAETAVEPGGFEASRIYRLFSTTAAVASLLLAAGLGVWSAITAPDQGPSTYALADLVEVMGRDADELETEWQTIESELATLERALAENNASSRDWDVLDDLDEELDILMYDIDRWPEGAEGAG